MVGVWLKDGLLQRVRTFGRMPKAPDGRTDALGLV